MKKWLFNLLFLLALLLLACQFREHYIIKNYELSVHHIRIVSIESESVYLPFYAYDSIRILEMEYDSVYKYKIESLNQQLKMLTQKIEKIEKEVESINNPLMVKAVESRLKLIGNEQNSVEKVLSIYLNTPEKTQLNAITERIQNLGRIPDSRIGYTLEVVFLGKQGVLSEQRYQRKYIFNCEKDCVLGIIQP